MKNLKIFLSHNENSLGGGLKIRDASPIQTEIIYIEDFLRMGNDNLITDNDIIHFSCNSSLIYEILPKIENFKCHIFNKEFLLNKYKKKDVQLKLNNEGIQIPKIYSDFYDISFPVFCKENDHTGMAFMAFTRATLEKIFTKFDKANFYLEKAILDSEKATKEIKVYYVDGSTFGKNGEKISDEIAKACQKIAKCLDNIEIFSADFIITSEGQYMIDFNAAVGFYLSNEGRDEFIKSVLKKGEK